jgi:hypothetical protein
MVWLQVALLLLLLLLTAIAACSGRLLPLHPC